MDNRCDSLGYIFVVRYWKIFIYIVFFEIDGKKYKRIYKWIFGLNGFLELEEVIVFLKI